MPHELSLPRQEPWNLVWVKRVFKVIWGRVSRVSLYMQMGKAKADGKRGTSQQYVYPWNHFLYSNTETAVSMNGVNSLSVYSDERCLLANLHLNWKKISSINADGFTLKLLG